MDRTQRCDPAAWEQAEKTVQQERERIEGIVRKMSPIEYAADDQAGGWNAACDEILLCIKEGGR